MSSEKDTVSDVTLTGDKNRTFFKLFLMTIVMFGFGFMLVPFYEAICEVTGINVLAAREKTDVNDIEKYLNNTQVDKSRTVIVEFDSNSHGPWVFKPKNSFVSIHPGELITVDFEITNPSSNPISGQAIPSYAPLQASGFLKKIECFCFKQQRLEGKETKDFPVVFLLDPNLPAEITNITMSYTFFEITNAFNDF
ncbi:MAG: cytochrome c oxidase assembly protein [Betaproteobacteria bacterium TMED156]|nr:MAG: cytochrome c oxidase assembly protein [Betaproteobacteria bacterium TMED156]|tara:strand:- start:280 stop:864 length:585 start_codon:yes stop_codon:yes gene_type:complete